MNKENEALVRKLKGQMERPHHDHIKKMRLRADKQAYIRSCFKGNQDTKIKGEK